jgi:hypothetical protein
LYILWSIYATPMANESSCLMFMWNLNGVIVD